MRRPSLTQSVYNATFPRPRPDDPTSFAAHVSRNLVPEVRIETQNFYGSLEDVEAQYPGLDYANAVHRMRLSRFPWHRRLFNAMDDLGLTSSEIDSICRWEGTKSARRNYEREEGIVVRDTTGEGIPLDDRSGSPISFLYSDYTYPTIPTVPSQPRRGRTRSEHPAFESLERPSSRRYSSRGHHSSRADARTYLREPWESEEDNDGNVHINSYGHELNQRLLIATEARARGHDVPVDEAYEQWLKDAAERGGYGNILYTIRTGNFPLYDSAGLISNPSGSYNHRGYRHPVTQSPPANTTTLPSPLATPVSRRHQASTATSRRAPSSLRPAAPSVRRI